MIASNRSSRSCRLFFDDSSKVSSSKVSSSSSTFLVVVVTMMMMLSTLLHQTATKRSVAVASAFQHVAVPRHRVIQSSSSSSSSRPRPSSSSSLFVRFFSTTELSSEQETAAKAASTTKQQQQQHQEEAASTTKQQQQQHQEDDEHLVNGRLPKGDLVLDLRTVSQELPTVLSHLKARHSSEETIESAERIVSLAQQRSTLIQERDAFLNQRKTASATVGQSNRQLNTNKDLTDDEKAEFQAALEAAKEQSNQAAEGAAKAEEALSEIQTTLDSLLAGIPNLLDDVVPAGRDENDNEVVSTWGDIDELPKQLGWYENFDNDNKFEPLWHDDVATGLGGYNVEAAVSMSGARFVALQGVVAQLERALQSFFVDLHTTQHGYTEVSVPYVVSRQALEGTSQLPKFQEDLFAITPESHTCNGQDAFLIPTAEVPVTNLHAGQILEQDKGDLPLSYVACTPCFRAEAGSYGRDTKGLIRTHQFTKVELVKITSAENSDDEHELLTQHAEACLQSLELPYRKVRLCAGDTGFAARHCYDLEVWLPGAREYREISSCSNTGDFQARRMALRYRPSAINDGDGGGDGGKNKKKKPTKVKPVFCHTINGSGLAIGRTLVAVLENYQKPDGSVVVPKALQPYMGGKEILLPPPPPK